MTMVPAAAVGIPERRRQAAETGAKIAAPEVAPARNRCRVCRDGNTMGGNSSLEVPGMQSCSSLQASWVEIRHLFILSDIITVDVSTVADRGE